MFEGLQREEERSPKLRAPNDRSGRGLAVHANPKTGSFLVYTCRPVTFPPASSVPFHGQQPPQAVEATLWLHGSIGNRRGPVGGNDHSLEGHNPRPFNNKFRNHGIKALPAAREFTIIRNGLVHTHQRRLQT